MNRHLRDLRREAPERIPAKKRSRNGSDTCSIPALGGEGSIAGKAEGGGGGRNIGTTNEDLVAQSSLAFPSRPEAATVGVDGAFVALLGAAAVQPDATGVHPAAVESGGGRPPVVKLCADEHSAEADWDDEKARGATGSIYSRYLLSLLSLYLLLLL